MTKGLPVEALESRASEQRRALHNDVSELRMALRERLDVKKNVAPYVLPASGVAAILGLAMGYLVAGAFTD